MLRGTTIPTVPVLQTIKDQSPRRELAVGPDVTELRRFVFRIHAGAAVLEGEGVPQATALMVICLQPRTGPCVHLELG